MKQGFTEEWDLWFLGLAAYAAGRSKDPSTQTGAAIIRPNKTVCSLGYNGFPRQMEDKKEWYENREEKYSRILHCEINAILNAAENLTGYTLYTWPFLSCDRCAVQVIQTGISTVVAPKLPPEDSKYERWNPILNISRGYFAECNVVVYEY